MLVFERYAHAQGSYPKQVWPERQRPGGGCRHKTIDRAEESGKQDDEHALNRAEADISDRESCCGTSSVGDPKAYVLNAFDIRHKLCDSPLTGKSVLSVKINQ